MVPQRVFRPLCALLATALGLAFGFAPAFAAEPASIQTVRAALVFNFIKFTELPAAAAADAKLRVCFATEDPAQIAALEALDARPIRGMTLAVARFRHQADCTVIYVDSSQHWKEIAERHAGKPALAIGGYAGFLAEGGVVEISLQESGARFDINLPEAKRAGLRFYPQLLRLARRLVE